MNPFHGILRDDTTGKASHTKLWSNIAYACATVVFLKAGWTAPAADLPVLFLVYTGVIGGSQVASKLIGAIYGQKPPST